eukprot:3479029-Amphidinium_carterae.1
MTLSICILALCGGGGGATLDLLDMGGGSEVASIDHVQSQPNPSVNMPASVSLTQSLVDHSCSCASSWKFSPPALLIQFPLFLLGE